MDVRQFVERGYSPYDERLCLGNRWTKDRDFQPHNTLEYFHSVVLQWLNMPNILAKPTTINYYPACQEDGNYYSMKKQKLIRPRDLDGNFIQDFDPLAPWIGFQEGNAIQYTFYVPHQPEELVKKLGRETFNNRLDSIFIASRKTFWWRKRSGCICRTESTVQSWKINRICISHGYLIFGQTRPDTKMGTCHLRRVLRNRRDSWIRLRTG